jgi:type I restriction enzyme S subunit
MSFDSVFDQFTLGDVAVFINGDRSTNYPKGDDYIADGIPFISAADLSDSRIQQEKVKRISNQAYDRLRNGKIRHQDILFCLRGSIGKLAFVQPNEVGAIASSLVIVRSTEKIDPRYLYYILCSQAGQQAAASLNNGSAQPNLSVGELQKVKIPLPSIAIQREITSVLGSLDDRITLLRETNITLEVIAQALFKSWFVDFEPVHAKMQGRAPEGMDEATAALFPDSFEESDLGVVPKGWRWGTLSDLATFQNGYAFKSKEWTDAGHPVVKIGDVKPGIIDLEGCSYVARETVVGLDRFKLSRGDLLVGMTGYVGETGLVPSTMAAAYLNQRVGRMAPKSGVTDLGHLYCAARSAAFKEFAEAQSHGSAQANVSGASLMAFPAVIAPPPLMECFNGAIADMLEVILINHEQAHTLSSVRDTLLPRLISGQLHVGGQPEVEHA